MYIPVSAKSGTYKEFYVTGSGSDANSGSKNAPFKTIQAAKEAVKKINTYCKKVKAVIQ